MLSTNNTNIVSKSTESEQGQIYSSYHINLLDILLILAKRWKMIVSVPFIASVITAIITLFISNIYTAKTMIIPSDDNSSSMGALLSQLGGLASMAGGVVGGKTTGDLYVTMLKSNTLKDPIIEKYRLKDHYEVKLRSDVYKMMDTATEVGLGKKDGVITILVSDKDPKLAADLANEYVDQLSKLANVLKTHDAGGNRIFLEKRIAETRADLMRAEDALKEFQSKNKAISVTDQAQATIAGVAHLRAQLIMQEVQLGTLQRQFTDSSQEVKTAKITIANLRSQIAGLEGKNGVSSSIPSVGSVPQLGQDYLRLMREFKIQEAVLEMLTKQFELAKLSESKDTPPFELLEKATAPDRKSKPKRAVIVILAAFATGFLMVLVVFLLEFSQQLTPEDKGRLAQIKGFLPNFPHILPRINLRGDKSS